MLGVGSYAEQQGRSTCGEPGQADEGEAGDVGDPALRPRESEVVEDRQIDPLETGPEAVGPQNGRDALPLQIELQPRVPPRARRLVCGFGREVKAVFAHVLVAAGANRLLELKSLGQACPRDHGRMSHDGR